MALHTLSIDQFTAATASGEPVPGGGSISALCGALAAALSNMVANLTIGKKKYADMQDKMTAIAEKLAPVPQMLLRAVDLDSEAYDLVFQAYKLPKATDEEKEVRTATIQNALKHAASVPFSVARMVNTFLPDIAELAEYGNQNAITDAFVASLCARTAILGACANARINLSSITDEAFATEMLKDIEVMEKNANETEQKVNNLLTKALS